MTTSSSRYSSDIEDACNASQHNDTISMKFLNVNDIGVGADQLCGDGIQ